MDTGIDKEFLELLNFQKQLLQTNSENFPSFTNENENVPENPTPTEDTEIWPESQPDLDNSNSASRLYYYYSINATNRRPCLKRPEINKNYIDWLNYKNSMETCLKEGLDEESQSKINKNSNGKLFSTSTSNQLSSSKECASKTGENAALTKNDYEIDTEQSNLDEDKNFDFSLLIKECGKALFRPKVPDKKGKSQEYKKIRDEFYTAAENIIRNWMGFIYITLSLRTNLVKFTLQQMQVFGTYDIHVHRQMLMENKCLTELVRDTQDFSDNEFLRYWRELERVIFNYLAIKNAVDGKRLALTKIESDINKLNTSHKKIIKSYKSKIDTLTKQIKDMEEQIGVEKEENANIKAALTYRVSLELIMKIIKKMQMPFSNKKSTNSC